MLEPRVLALKYNSLRWRGVSVALAWRSLNVLTGKRLLAFLMFLAVLPWHAATAAGTRAQTHTDALKLKFDFGPGKYADARGVNAPFRRARTHHEDCALCVLQHRRVVIARP
jgi:hypothetical protein